MTDAAAYSEQPEVALMSTTDKRSATLKPQKLLIRSGLSHTLVSDYGTLFTSSIFPDISRQNNIKYIRSPPHHPWFSCQAERLQEVCGNGGISDSSSSSFKLVNTLWTIFSLGCCWMENPAAFYHHPKGCHCSSVQGYDCGKRVYSAAR
ncbi:uncharacterized protein DEA37_0000131 [Paragonimus westermani]|uniref:Integrase catalytic domain-containing protein n=1 Tax=Paragonimus westermani TaxID=34504 RepID=A0A5J4P283_9TREM|nr:uncharacterized protein DEA37_0000131 [Paragonimus westermani]